MFAASHNVTIGLLHIEFKLINLSLKICYLSFGKTVRKTMRKNARFPEMALQGESEIRKGLAYFDHA